MSTSIVAASYALAALAFLILSLFLLTRWRARQHAAELAAACLLTAAWGASTAAVVTEQQSLIWLTEVLEILRSAAWAFFLLSVLGQLHTGKRSMSRASLFPLAGIGIFCFLLLGATIFLRVNPAYLAGAGGFMVIIVGRAAAAVLNMLLIEQLYRNSAPEERWAIKYACLGIGGLFAYDFYLYSDAMLFHRINVEIWAARGLADALTAPLIAISAARNPRWSKALAISRTVLFHSAVIIGSAAYLLAMAAAGYYLRLFGGTWGTVMQVVFLFGAGILLFAALFSGSARAWLRVFISKHFYSYRYDYREEWIRFTRALSDAGAALNERTIQTIAQPMECSSGALFLRKDDSVTCESVTHWNMPPIHHAAPLDSSLCVYLQNTQWVIDLQEYEACPDKYESLILPEWLANMRAAWLVVPLLLERQLFGFVLLGRPRSRMRLNWETIDLLKIAGAQAASYLAQRESQHALMVARQFESYTRMSTFIVHDLKNLISQLSLMVTNAERHKDNPEFQADMLETVELSVKKMKLLLQKLSRGPETDTFAPVLLSDILIQAVQQKSSFDFKPVLHLDTSDLVVLADHARLERVLGHLVQNAIEATPRSGTVAVRLCRSGDQAVIEVKDSGHGMTEEFIRDKLFTPFESTKAAGMGIGVFESRAYIRLLGGEISVHSVPSYGTTFRVSLPIHQYDHKFAAAAA